MVKFQSYAYGKTCVSWMGGAIKRENLHGQQNWKEISKFFTVQDAFGNNRIRLFDLGKSKRKVIL